MLLVLSACAPKLPAPPPWTPAPPVSTVAPKPISEGSLWTPNTPYSDLFGDLRAHSVGDVVTVNIVERAEALQSASTETSRDSSLSASVSSLFGAPLSAGGFKPEAAGSLENDFEGSGVTQRKDNLVATVTAKVVEVLPGGLLRIEGYRDVTINNERHYILLRGVVRPVDISPDNSVPSTSVADSQIIYSGSGVVSDKQRPGWMTRALDYVWPF
jgi:flagellar L-ring protein precursor FlgH